MNDVQIDARRIYAAALTDDWTRGRDIAARCVLFSGGDDSTTLVHLFRDQATHLIHVNTGTGIPDTLDYVRDVAATYRLTLIEVTPPDSYDDLVLGRVTTKAGEPIWKGGFPGPGAHGLMYQRLKERALDKARHQLGIANAKTRCAIWIAGRRRDESRRRAEVPEIEADGSVIWASPLVRWTKLDLNAYRKEHRDVPRNPVAANLHMSGECLCGAFAKPGELEHLRFWYPDVAARIDNLQTRVTATGAPTRLCQWGHGIEGRNLGGATARLCSSCDSRQMAFTFEETAE